MAIEGIVPIRNKFLQPNWLLSLEFDEGFVYGRVVRRRIMHYRPWRLINSSGTVQDISPGGSVGEIRFRDSRNKDVDILHLNEETSGDFAWILHGGIGIGPTQIRMYPRIPEGKNIPGRFPDLDPIVPSSGDHTAYVSGLESPYEEPTDFVEYVIPPKIHISAEFYNRHTEATINPSLNLLFALYFFQVLSPDTPNRSLIGRIARREIPAGFLTTGAGDAPIQGRKTIKAWDTRALSLDEASVM